MGRPDSTAKLRELRAAAERISATLVDLELDPGRQMVDAAPLAGRTAERWAAGRTALAELWRRQGLLEATLERADRVRGQALGELLFGASVELQGPDVPVGQRALLPGDTPGERCTPDQLLGSMSALFEAVKAALGEITRAWDALLPQLEECRRRLTLAHALSEELGAAERTRPAAGEEAVGRLAEHISGDPLSVASTDVDEQLDALAGLVGELDRDAELKRTLDLRIDAGRELLNRIGAAIGEADRAGEALEGKIAGATRPELPSPPGDLAGRLESIITTAHDGDWRAARSQLDRWTSDAEARLQAAEHASAAGRAPITTRNEFRALLDAYAVKAKAVGLIEERDVAEIYEQAHTELYTAPTDVIRAGELIRRLQRALTGVSAGREVTR